jgi:hypothetical protein
MESSVVDCVARKDGGRRVALKKMKVRMMMRITKDMMRLLDRHEMLKLWSLEYISWPGGGTRERRRDAT